MERRIKSNALPGGARRLAVVAVKGACFSRLSERRPLRTSGRSRPRFQAGRAVEEKLFPKGNKVVRL
jgi:hypothetical protein